MTSLHNHLSFHRMFDRVQLAEVTCVAEWESGVVEDVLPCIAAAGPNQMSAAQQARLATLRS